MSGVQDTEETVQERRQKRREDRFRSLAYPTVRKARMGLNSDAKELREFELAHRNAGHEEIAEDYREAANAIEDALAELERYFEEYDDE